MVFVDNPVGTGYSYVEDPKLLPRNNTAIANNLVAFMRGFFTKVFLSLSLFLSGKDCQFVLAGDLL